MDLYLLVLELRLAEDGDKTVLGVRKYFELSASDDVEAKEKTREIQKDEVEVWDWSVALVYSLTRKSDGDLVLA